MTNKERARAMMDKWEFEYLVKGPSLWNLSPQDKSDCLFRLRTQIEAALDEAEERGEVRFCRDLNAELLNKLDDLIKSTGAFTLTKAHEKLEQGKIIPRAEIEKVRSCVEMFDGYLNHNWALQGDEGTQAKEVLVLIESWLQPTFPKSQVAEVGDC